VPGPLAYVHRLWHKHGIDKWWGRSSSEVLDELVSDPRLRTVLLAKKGNYGGMNGTEISFGVQAMVMRHYFNGASYPVGGAKVFAEALVQAIEQAGGALRLNAKVREFMVEDRTVVRARLEDETPLRAPQVFLDIGARNTVGLFAGVNSIGNPFHHWELVQTELVSPTTEHHPIRAFWCWRSLQMASVALKQGSRWRTG
jgi:all-trans-retinol 13,14-reductase